jgi:hypothetical protein
MITIEPEQKQPGLQVDSMPFMAPQASMLTLTAPWVLKDAKATYRPLARVCENAAKLQRLNIEKLKYEGTYALLGISEDGSVMALSWRDDAWLPTRAPVPSLVARSQVLGLVRLDAQVPLKPVWARVNSQRLTILKNGKEIEIWRTPALSKPALKPEAPEQEIGTGNSFEDILKPADVNPPDPEIPIDIADP